MSEWLIMLNICLKCFYFDNKNRKNSKIQTQSAKSNLPFNIHFQNAQIVNFNNTNRLDPANATSLRPAMWVLFQSVSLRMHRLPL
jgi:hypothetical protein